MRRTNELRRKDIEKLISRDISLFSQTTKPLDGFQEIGELIKSRMKEERHLSSTTPSVARYPIVLNMHEFAEAHLVIFNQRKEFQRKGSFWRM